MSPRSSTARRPRSTTSPIGRLSEDFVPLEELLQPTMDEIDAIASSGGLARGVPTGFVELDEVTNGLHPGQMIIVAARPGVGKALALDTPLPTPTGWTTMGDVAVGDELLGADGRPTRVVAATEVMFGRPCYEVEFSDGTVDCRGRAASVADEHAGVRCELVHCGRMRTIIGPNCGHHVDYGRCCEPSCAIASSPVRCLQVDSRGPPVPGRAGQDPHAQLDFGAGLPAVLLDQAPHGQRHLLAGDEQVRDRHAAAVGGGEDQTRRYAVRPDERRRLAAPGATDE